MYPDRFSESSVVAAAEDLHTFWVGIVGYAVMAALCFYFGFKKDEQ